MDEAHHHSHQCGLTALGALDGYGCGHVWSHHDATQYTISAHYCPQCGKGPFTARLSELVDKTDRSAYSAWDRTNENAR